MAYIAPRWPAVYTTLRGLCYAEITVRTAKSDLHSGEFGGAAPNAHEELARLLGRLKAPDGKIHIPGLYASVKRPSQLELATWKRLPFKEGEFLKHRVQAKALTGLKAYSVLERLCVNKVDVAPDPVPHNYDETVRALNNIHARVIGINSGIAPFSGRDELASLLEGLSAGSEIKVEVEHKEPKKTAAVTVKLAALPDAPVPEDLPEPSSAGKALTPRKHVPMAQPQPPGVKKEEPKKDEPKKDEPKKDEPKKDAMAVATRLLASKDPEQRKLGVLTRRANINRGD